MSSEVPLDSKLSGSSRETSKSRSESIDSDQEGQNHVVSLLWKDIKVRTKAGRLLLDGVSGVAVPGEVIALMGASGAGKTTLLNTLLYRNLKGLQVEGEMLANGQNIGKRITSVSSYVQQEDLFIHRLTVREHLQAVARMKLRNNSNNFRRRRVEEVIKLLCLEKSQNSRIGVPGIIKGISGGEMKRLAFASEMLNNPAILFCDEPTTGLDSHMAYQVVKTLEEMSREQKKTIICTIHQPSSEVFELFDKVVFLAQGQIAFHGAIEDAIYHFADCGYIVPNHTNPADYYIDKLAIHPDRADECKKLCKTICKQYRESPYYDILMNQMKICRDPRRLIPRKGVSFFSIYIALLIRYLKDNQRNPAVLKARVLQKIYIGLFMGLLYWRTSNDQDGVVNLEGALFYLIADLSYATLHGILGFMPFDYPIVVREYQDRTYPIAAYYLAKISAMFPIFTVDGWLLVLLSYFMVGFPADVMVFARHLVTCTLIEWTVVACAVLLSCISPTYVIAVTVSAPMMTIISLTGGLFTNISTIPVWIGWIQYMSWFRFGYEALIINVFTHESFNSISCSRKGGVTSGNSCQKSGQEVIDNLSFDSSKLYFNWAAMMFYVILFYVIGYIGLVIRVRLSK